jgi:GH24 family phage-related lysozyme (muramidase)
MALDDCLRAIAKFLRIMKRLWQGQGMGGLLRRREAEAQLVESAIGA